MVDYYRCTDGLGFDVHQRGNQKSLEGHGEMLVRELVKKMRKLDVTSQVESDEPPKFLIQRVNYGYKESKYEVNADNPISATVLMYDFLGMDCSKNYTISNVESKYQEKVGQWNRLKDLLDVNGLFATPDINNKWRFANQRIVDAYRSIKSRSIALGAPRLDQLVEFDFESMDDDFKKKFVCKDLLLQEYMLNKAHELELRKHFNMLYIPKLIDGRNTFAFESYMTVNEFMNDILKDPGADMEKNMMYAILCMPHMEGRVAKRLVASRSARLPFLHRDRHVFSFPNGLWFAKRCQFFDYEDSRIPEMELASSSFNDDLFDPRWLNMVDNPMAIPTPEIDSILEFQGYSGRDLELCYTLFGRLQYELKDPDAPQDQIEVWLQGLPRCGKGTLLALISDWYDPSDIGEIDNNLDADRPIASLKDNFINIGSDIGYDWRMPRVTWRKLVSAEPIVFRQKHIVEAKLKYWKVPHIEACNEFPKFFNNDDSITYRLMVIRFPNDVTEAGKNDADKLDKCRKENVAWRTKCRLCFLKYKAARERQGTKIKNFRDYIKGSKFEKEFKAIMQASDPLICFINSSMVEKAPIDKDTGRRKKIQQYEVSFSVFNKAYSKFCVEQKLQHKKLVVDNYKKIFKQFMFQRKKQHKVMIKGKEQKRDMIIGCYLEQD